jgi:hypothetical protein
LQREMARWSKTKRWVVGLAGALVAALALTGCGKGINQPDPGAPAEHSPVGRVLVGYGFRAVVSPSVSPSAASPWVFAPPGSCRKGLSAANAKVCQAVADDPVFAVVDSVGRHNLIRLLGARLDCPVPAALQPIDTLPESEQDAVLTGFQAVEASLTLRELQTASGTQVKDRAGPDGTLWTGCTRH